MSQTVTLHRVLTCAPEKIYRAFLTADALAKFNPPYGFYCSIEQFDPAVGGTYKMSFTNFTTGETHRFGGRFAELAENEKIVMTDQFDDPNLPGEMITEIHLKQVSCGTELTIVQSGIPDVIPAESCYLGWQETLVQLAHLVEPEIRA